MSHKRGFSIKDFIESDEYLILHDEIQRDLNRQRVVINRAVFRKTANEKLELKKAKKSHKKFLKKRNVGV